MGCTRENIKNLLLHFTEFSDIESGEERLSSSYIHFPPFFPQWNFSFGTKARISFRSEKKYARATINIPWSVGQNFLSIFISALPSCHCFRDFRLWPRFQGFFCCAIHACVLSRSISAGTMHSSLIRRMQACIRSFWGRLLPLRGREYVAYAARKMENARLCDTPATSVPRKCRRFSPLSSQLSITAIDLPQRFMHV